MKSIETVFKSGFGPSSSHTVGPSIACKIVNRRYPKRDYIVVTLYGSLSLTGKGHGTDKAIKTVLPDAKVIFDNSKEISELPHPNTMKFEIYYKEKKIDELTVMSIGGGEIQFLNEEYDPPEIYKENSFSEIIEVCKKENLTLPQYIYKNEGPGFKDDLRLKWKTMKECIKRGLETEGILPGKLQLTRKAKLLYNMKVENEGPATKEDRIISSYAFAVSEENADGHMIVVAPTCGAAGVIPVVLYYLEHNAHYKEEDIIDGLAVAGLIGNIIRTNASLSGAECGCQAEIGSACSMAAGAKAQINKMNLEQIEYAAEVSMEHHLGLTCDPVMGYVQIPCIERNAIAAMRAINAVNLSRFLYVNRRISFDAVIETMYKTGCDLSEKYRETSNGGLASLYK